MAQLRAKYRSQLVLYLTLQGHRSKRDALLNRRPNLRWMLFVMLASYEVYGLSQRRWNASCLGASRRT